MPPDAPTAFFSYSREDSEFALRLAEDLRTAGADVWLDQLDIAPGQRWARAVQEALQSSARVLVILSPASVNSNHVEDEVSFALDEQKTVIPVFYQECKVPFRLRPLQYVDFRADYDHGLKIMLKTLAVKQQPVASPANAPTALRGSLSTAAHAEEGGKSPEELEEERKQIAERARLEEEQRRVATEKARLEQQERERQAAVEKARLEKEERERKATERARLEDDERRKQVAAEKARLEQVEHTWKAASDDQLDEAWEAERQRRQRELSKALVEEWSTHGTVHGNIEETQLIKKLRSALDEWLSKRPPGFESRQIKRREQQQAETRRAIDLWRQRTGG